MRLKPESEEPEDQQGVEGQGLLEYMSEEVCGMQGESIEGIPVRQLPQGQKG